MLTLITGTPGAGKSLYAVWNFAKPVPGSTIENNGVAVPRRLLSNVKNLLVEHEHITAEDLDRWHEWAQPGDVILFDEVQEVWRPRGLGTKVPDCIAKLETHRHMGVDLILVTQHPMLIDPNIRRLVNQHIHIRRISKTYCYRYEWDHCANIANTKTTVDSGLFSHPKEAYGLYKSAQLHTKPTTKIPKVAYVGVLALAGLLFGLGPIAYARITDTFGSAKQAEQPKEPNDGFVPAPAFAQENSVPVASETPEIQPEQPAQDNQAIPQGKAEPVLVGCASKPKGDGCICFNDLGRPVDPDPHICEDFRLRPKPIDPLMVRDTPQRQDPRDLDMLQFASENRPKGHQPHYIHF